MDAATPPDHVGLAGRLLARADGAVARGQSVMAYLLDEPDRGLFNDAIVARVRNMVADLAYQLLYARAEAVGEADRARYAEEHTEVLARTLRGHEPLLDHCHALAVEHQMSEAMAEREGLDPVLTPALQNLIANSDAAVSSLAMQVLAAQARFVQGQRRMELGLADLPADHLDAVLRLWRGGDPDGRSDTLRHVEQQIRSRYDEGATRLTLLARLVSAPDHKAEGSLLRAGHAGIALFASALSSASGQLRDTVVVAAAAADSVRLALAMRAAGLDREAIGASLLALQSEPSALSAVERLAPKDARNVLSGIGAAG